MPISHKYRAIFVHIPKNAGSSIEKALGIWGKNNDGSLTPACPDILFGVEKGKALQHLTASEIRSRIGVDVFTKYYTFTFVRNPFDRLVSEYNWRLKEGYKFTFEQFIKKYIPIKRRFFDSKKDRLFADHLLPQYEFIRGCFYREDIANFKPYEYDGQYNIVNFIGRMESFDADFNVVAKTIGISQETPKENCKHQKKIYKEYFTEETKHIVEDAYKVDLQMFGYQF